MKGGFLTLGKADFDEMGCFQTVLLSVIDNEVFEKDKVMNKWKR